MSRRVDREPDYEYDVHLHGSKYKEACNQAYFMDKSRYVCGKPIYRYIDGEKEERDLFMFFGRKEAERKTEEEGWFIAHVLVEEGTSVEDYLLFNPSPTALFSDQCNACWHTQGGRWDLGAFCQLQDREEEEAAKAAPSAEAKGCIAEGMAGFMVMLRSEERPAPAEPAEHSDRDESADTAAEAFSKQLLTEHDHKKSLCLPCFREFGCCGSDPSRGIEPVKVTDWVRLDKLGELIQVEIKFVLWSKIKPRGVMQGNVGNCWFLSALAAVSEFPAKIRQIFGNISERTESRLYEVTLYHPGQQRFVQVCIDEEIPIYDKPVPGQDGKTEKSYAASRPYVAYDNLTHVSNEVWALLLEKAFAKLCGSYEATQRGLACWGLVYLCGGQGVAWKKMLTEKLPLAEFGTHVLKWTSKRWQRFYTDWGGGKQPHDKLTRNVVDKASGQKTKDHENLRGVCSGDFNVDAVLGVAVGSCRSSRQLWQKIQEYASKGYPMCASILTLEGKDLKGLLSDHGYTVLAARELNCDGHDLYLIKLRDPVGALEWQGDWGDQSPHWKTYPAIAEQLRFKNRNDGTFWMTFQDFDHIFDGLDAVKVSMPLQGCHWDKLRAMHLLD